MAEPPQFGRLQEHFSKIVPEKQASGWNDMWQEETTPWDRKGPSIALMDTLDEHNQEFGSPLQDDHTQKTEAQPSRKKALVPGCGRGYDALLLASYGYDTYGLDVAPIAIENARKQLSVPDFEERYPVRSTAIGRGEIKFVLDDFFEGNIVDVVGEKFDVIFDYTFLCALPPDWRPNWARRMSELLKPTGRLVCLEWPLTKSPKLPGPPYGLSGDLYEQILAHPGRAVKYGEDGYMLPEQCSDPNANALVRVDRWQPRRTHKAGEGSDHVSLWKHIEQ